MDLFLLLAVLKMGWIAQFLPRAVPRGLPALQVPGLHLLRDHASTITVAAVALVLIGFSQTADDARTFAARHHYRIDINQESAAQAQPQGSARSPVANEAPAA